MHSDYWVNKLRLRFFLEKHSSVVDYAEQKTYEIALSLCLIYIWLNPRTILRLQRSFVFRIPPTIRDDSVTQHITSMTMGF